MIEPTALPLNVPSLLSNLDALKLELLPLSDHFAVKCDEHSRETYGSLLAALLLTGGEISAEQSRLFKLLLGSLKLGDIQAQLFERAQALNLDALREFFRVARENELTTSFFMDSLVLCRLSGPLVDAQHQLLSELADLLKLPEADLPVIVGLAAVALGLPCEVDIPSEFDRATVSAWEEFLYRQLTADRLAAGVLRGWWLVTEPIKVNVAWNMDNARLRFTGDGSLISDTEGRISISRSYLERPIIKLSGKLEFDLKESLVDGVYDEHAQATAISLNSVSKANFKLTKFQTINARTIFINNSISELTECQFIECGHNFDLGGAICMLSSLIAYRESSGGKQPSEKINISYCDFTLCTGRVGGGVYAVGLNEDAITNSNFSDCKSAYHSDDISIDLNTHAFGGGAIFTENSTQRSVDKCKFKNTTIQIGNPGDTYNPVVKDSIFVDAYVSVYKAVAGYVLVTGCTFNNSFAKNEYLIDQYLVTPKSAQKWWSEFK